MTVAADRLHLSQSAVSNAISRLNTALGMILFVKNNRAIAPSRQAVALYKDVKCCLQKISSTLKQEIHFDPASSERTFRIATSNYGEIVLFTKLVSHLEHCAPNIKVIREFIATENLSQCLHIDQLDLGLFFDRPNETGIHKEFLCRDPLVLITGPQHSLLPDKLTIDDIKGLDFVSLKNECNNFDFVLPTLNDHPDYLTPRFTVATMWSMFFIVSTTKLAAITPLLYAKTLENHLPIKVHYLTEVEQIKLNLYWRDIETQDAGHKWLRELIKDLFVDNPCQPRPLF